MKDTTFEQKMIEKERKKAFVKSFDRALAFAETKLEAFKKTCDWVGGPQKEY